MKKIIVLFSGIFLALMGAMHCTSTGIVTADNNPATNDNGPVGENPMTTAETFANAVVNLNIFSLGSDFPPNIQIPDLDGMRSTAFVVTDFPALGVVPVDLETGLFSENFAGLDATPSGISSIVLYSKKVLILSSTQALYLGGGGVVYFNPTTGEVLETINLTDPLTLTEVLPYSRPGDCDFDGTPESSVGPGPFSPSGAADMALIGNKLFVTLSNYCFDGGWETFYPKSLVRIYDFNGSPPTLTPAATPYLALSGFNATGITVVGDQLIVTSTGDTKLVGGVSIPETPSYLDEVDPQTPQITRTLNLGMVAANFEAMAVTEDAATAFIGSSAFSEVYEINLVNFSVVRGENNPIEIFSGDDFITDQEIAFGENILFVSSFNHDAVRAIDLTSSDRPVLEKILDFSFEGSPGVGGAGPMAVRPGQPGVDYSGADLFVLTAQPGTLSSARTY